MLAPFPTSFAASAQDGPHSRSQLACSTSSAWRGSAGRPLPAARRAPQVRPRDRRIEVALRTIARALGHVAGLARALHEVFRLVDILRDAAAFEVERREPAALRVAAPVALPFEDLAGPRRVGLARVAVRQHLAERLAGH